jgi:CHAD domain-containing protein
VSVVTEHIKAIQKELLLNLKKPVGRRMLHDLRVEIKKLQALWAIHPIGHGIGFGNKFPKTHLLFKTAAKARDLQMIRHHLNTLPSMAKHKSLDKKLDKAISTKKLRFKKLLGRKKMLGRLSNEMHDQYYFFKMASSLLLKQRRRLFKEQTFDAIVQQSTAQQGGLHALRKRIKYIIFQNEAFHGRGHQVHGENQALLGLQQQLGIWHDWYNVVRWIRRQAKKTEAANLDSLIEEAECKETFIKRQLLKEIKIFTRNLHEDG